MSCCKSGAEVAPLCMAVFLHCGPLKLQLKSSNRITLREEGREQRKDKVTDNWIAEGRLACRLNGGKTTDGKKKRELKPSNLLKPLLNSYPPLCHVFTPSELYNDYVSSR